MNRTQIRQNTLSRKGLAWFLLVVSAFFVGNLIWRAPGWWHALQKPFRTEQSSFANLHAVKFASRLNLLLINKVSGEVNQLMIASYDPAGKQVVFLSLPVDGLVSPQIGEQDSLKKICSQSFSGCFWQTAVLSGASLSGYLSFSNANLNESTIQQTRKNLFSLGFFLDLPGQKQWLDDHLQTNLTTSELYTLASKFKSTTTDSLRFVDLSGSIVNGAFDETAVNDMTKELFIDSETANEAASVKIVNGTVVSGLGSSFKRIVANSGGLVVGVEDGTSNTTQVILHSNKDLLAERLASFLNVKVTKSSAGSEADIEVILGKDLLTQIGF